MGQRQDILKEIVLKRFHEFKHKKLTLKELENSKLFSLVNDTYNKLGGQFQTLPTNYGPWDISTKEFIIELDEERHFNRYRLETLNSKFYDDYNGFSLSDYKSFCKDFEKHCLCTASWGKNWKNDSTEKMFMKSNSEGDLLGSGSSRWRQRAYYDFLKDITAIVKNIPIFRVSIYDTFRGNSIDRILIDKDSKTINDLIDEIRKKHWL